MLGLNQGFHFLNHKISNHIMYTKHRFRVCSYLDSYNNSICLGGHPHLQNVRAGNSTSVTGMEKVLMVWTVGSSRQSEMALLSLEVCIWVLLPGGVHQLFNSETLFWGFLCIFVLRSTTFRKKSHSLTEGTEAIEIHRGLWNQVPWLNSSQEHLFYFVYLAGGD